MSPITRKNVLILIGFMATALFLDQLSKLLIVNTLTPFMPPREIIGSLLRFKLTYNPYGVFSISFGHGSLYYIFQIAGIILFTYVGLVQSDRYKVVIFGLIIGGAIGNVIDRLRMGHVIDFIDMGIGDLRWFTYNLADAFITIGAVVLIAQEVFFKKPQSEDLTVRSP